MTLIRSNVFHFCNIRSRVEYLLILAVVMLARTGETCATDYILAVFV